MNTRRRAKSLLSTAAGFGIILMMSASPAIAHGGHYHGHGVTGLHYGIGHYKRHHYNRNHYYHHVVTNWHRHSHHQAGYDRGHRYRLTDRPYATYQQPGYRTNQVYGAGYHRNSPNFGNAAGGALGGYLGSKIGKGSGRLAATAAGAVIGYSIGGRLGAPY